MSDPSDPFGINRKALLSLLGAAPVEKECSSLASLCAPPIYETDRRRSAAEVLWPNLPSGNPPEPKERGLAGMFAAPTNLSSFGVANSFIDSSFGSLLNPSFGSLVESPITNAFEEHLRPAINPPIGTPMLDALRGYYAPPPPIQRPPVVPAKVSRKTFFSFYYDDIMRVNVVRKAYVFKHPSLEGQPSYRDSSLWEARKLNNDDAIKNLIRAGVRYTSVVCVLVGVDTYSRRWCKYEIARAVIDGRGLLAVHLNSIPHHKTKTPHTRGHNPLRLMAVGKVQTNPLAAAKYFLFENKPVPNDAGGWDANWVRYADYTDAVDLPRWLDDMQPGQLRQLSQGADEHDYMAEDGHKNMSGWIDRAAEKAGR